MTVAYPISASPIPTLRSLPVLVAADSAPAERRALQALEDAGLRGGGAVPIAEAAARLADQARLGLLWIELEEFGDAAERLLRQVDEDVQGSRYSAVVAAPAELIDPVSALVTAPEIEVVIGRSELQRAAALAVVASHGPATGVRDSASDESGARLRQLSEEVSRIAATLARLSGEGGTAPVALTGTEAPPTGDLPSVPAESVRTIIRARRNRGKYLPADLFADPAWDMLLDLLQAELVQHRVPVSSLCIAAAVPATTALRWIKTMTDRGLLVRRPDPHDGRRVFMEMSRATSHAVRRFFKEVGPALV